MTPTHCKVCGRGMFNRHTGHATPDKPVVFAGRGLCSRCYRRDARGLPPTLVDGTPTTWTHLDTPGHTPTTHLPALPEPTNPNDLTWQASALCAQTDPDVWFPERGDPIAPAKRICRGPKNHPEQGCPVRDICLRFALDNKIEHGVWGGLSSSEREKLRKRGAA